MATFDTGSLYGYAGFYNYFKATAVKFTTPSKRIRVTAITLRLGMVPNGYDGRGVNGNVNVKGGIWSNNASPFSRLAESSNSLNTSSIGTSGYNTATGYVETTFNIDATLDANTTYMFGVFCPSSSAGAAGYGNHSLGWAQTKSGITGYVCAYYPGQSSWEAYVSGPRAPWMRVTYQDAYTTPTINITSPAANTLVNKDSNMTIGWDAWGGDGGAGSTVEMSVNGSSWFTISGSSNSAGSTSIRPSSYGVGAGTSFTVSVRRRHSNTGSYSSTSSRTFRTYSIPSVTGLKINYNPINANTTASITWNSWSGSYSESSNLHIQINGSSWISCGTNATSWSGALQSYVPFSKDNQNITITVRRTHANTGVTATQSITVKVLYTPTKQITNLTPNPVGTVASSVSSTSISWSYPSGQNGIVSRYDVVLTDPNDSSRTVTYTTTSPSCSIITNDLVPTIDYTITIYPVYTNNTTITSRGPGYTVSKYITRVTQLPKPVISYPISGKTWWKNTFRVAFQLPTDADYNYLPTDIKQNYLYSDIEIRINGITKSITANPGAFSLLSSELAHEARIVFNPILANFGISDTVSTFTIAVRVRKKYIDPSLAISWSEWSNNTVINNVAITYPSMTVNNEIKLAHITSVDKTIVDMCNSYIASSYGSYDFIERRNFELLYNKIISVTELINNYSDYNSARENVKFKVPEVFVPQIVQVNATGDQNYLRRVLDYMAILTQ